MDVSEIKTTQGLCYFTQIVLAGIGGIYNLVLGGNPFWNFVYWSTVVISGLLLAAKVFGILPTLEAKFFWFNRAILGYVAVWAGLYGICSIMSFISFNLGGVLLYITLATFVVDLILRYLAYRKGGPDITASNPTATAASGGEVPKY